MKGGFCAMEFITHSVEETEALGARVAASLKGGDVIAYTGELGMGKTAFTRGLARGLSCRGRVSSPTFTIVNEYEGTVPLFHFDMYRLSCADELFDIGWEDYLARGGVCAVEWSERVSEIFDPDTISVAFARHSENENCDGILRAVAAALKFDLASDVTAPELQKQLKEKGIEAFLAEYSELGAEDIAKVSAYYNE